MSEGPRKLHLSLKVADRIIQLSTVVGDFEKDGAELTARRFNRWIDHTRELLEQNIDKQTMEDFESLPRLDSDADTLEKIGECSKRHADFLREIVSEIEAT